jgi:hypothetical protein
MDLNNLDISKLPTDVRKQFKQLRLLHTEKKDTKQGKRRFYVLC